MNALAPAPPDALLLITTQCAYCPTVLQSLGELVKQGRIGRLEVVNIAVRADLAAHYGVRSVPWIRLGEFELEGMHSRAELDQWVERAGTAQGLVEYYSGLLSQGKLPKVIHAIRRNPGHLSALLTIAADADADLTVRIGVSAVMEDLAGTELLQQRLAELLTLSGHGDPRVRADAGYFLALTESPEAITVLEALSNDTEQTVREVARDSLEDLRAALRT
jgi:hypothetical protein